MDLVLAYAVIALLAFSELWCGYRSGEVTIPIFRARVHRKQARPWFWLLLVVWSLIIVAMLRNIVSKL